MCVGDQKMNRNMLNDDKTEFIVFKSKLNTFAEQNVQVGCTQIRISSKINNLV